MDSFGFTQDDLLANRENKLTPRQQKLVTSYIKIAAVSTRLAVVACVGTVLLYFGIGYAMRPENGFGQALPYLIFAAALFVGIFAFFIMLGFSKSRQLRERQISTITGTANRSTKKLNYGRWTAYYVMIGNIKFQLQSQDQFDILQDNAQYRVFYIQYPPAHIILSLEPLAATNQTF